MLTNLGDRGNQISFWLISLSLLKNVPVLIELKKYDNVLKQKIDDSYLTVKL